MNMSLFATLFIFQFVAHLVGDYLIQGSNDSIKKSEDVLHRLRHCLMYSASIFAFVAFIIPIEYAFAVWVITLIEHMIIDSRKPVVGWKTFFERKIMRNKEFRMEGFPFFVLIEIDQTFHMVRIFIISAVLSHLL